ncbi:MAG: UDP-glucose--hexose-1-phosphate uridylyltransferase [Bacteroidetes bacterium]|nr:UDP-glucose--hexose-1-phosphate uridylyltransferase [Bacteroidota bacterium]MBU1116522.1 UDP-glucose--hexose-1-phosphate uridylyltransferase [Bacteroidota bacterium]MBU1798404.1 UDP-glucose--hexose-1-phosphate uridylyltransferase [Bacteroidota bacterium]
MKNTHRRYNPLTDEWILVSPNRTQRPWQGQNEKSTKEDKLSYDPDCYLCPNNIRANGVQNPDYKSTHVFVNDFSSLVMGVKKESININNLIIAESEEGICKVVCFSPKHNLTLTDLSNNEIKNVITTWQNEFDQLGSLKEINHVQIFENKGSVMGASNPHPHGQIWAQHSIPMEPLKEQNNQKKYFDAHKTTLLNDYLKLELDRNERIVYENENFAVIVPYWAVWPFETMIISKKAFKNILEFNDSVSLDFADAIKTISTKYDNVFNISFPYSAGIHQAPTDGNLHPEWHFHMHFYPPLLRSATIKKFMVGYEMLANPQRDITAELSTEILRKA